MFLKPLGGEEHNNLIQADLEANDLIDHGLLVSSGFLNENLFSVR